LVLLLLTALSASVGAQGPTSAPTFELRTAAGKTVKGPLRKLTDDWSVQVGTPRAKSVGGAAVISLRRVNTPPPGYPRGPQVVLGNGSRLPGIVDKIADDRLHLRPNLPVQAVKDRVLKLPLSAVAVVWLAAPDRVSRPDLFLRRLARGRRARDVLLLRNGDRIEGTLLGLDPTTFRLETEGKKTTTVPRAKVVALAFNTELLSRARPKGIYAQLVLANGARLILAAARLAGGSTLQGKLAPGGWVDVPLTQVAALDFRQGCAVYLSDLKPAGYKHTPFFGVRWPYVTDGSVAGRDLRLGGGTYDKGLGMHSKSRLTYDLRKGYRRFEALVGLDADTGRKGRVRVRVLLDGKPADIGLKKELTAKDRPLRIRLDVTGKRTLTLEVDFGSYGDVQSHVNWADAFLVKRAENDS
jgi:hypothetical protein